MIKPLLSRLKSAVRGETAATHFDVSRLATVNAVLEEAGATPLETLPPAATRDGRVERVFDLRSDLRGVFPLARTPHPHRRDYLRWLARHGRVDFPITLEEIVASLRRDDARPDRGLAVTYRLNPAWQRAVPNALESHAGFDDLKRFVSSEYGFRCRWLRRARLAELDPPATGPGVNLVGHFLYPSGLQEAVVGLGRACELAGVPVTRRDLPMLIDVPADASYDYRGLERYSTTLTLAAVNTFPEVWRERSGVHWRPGVKRVALWYWELEEVPGEFVPQMQWPDEVWAPTEFLKSTFERVVSVPVRAMLPGVELSQFQAKSRAELGLPGGFVFLVTFDMGSVMRRKNPLGAVAAFAAAFPGGRAGVSLVVKVSRGDSVPDDLAELVAAVKAAPGVLLIDRVLPRGEVMALLNSADCYVSLHRAEGFGLGLAESMLLGKPVVASDYSGNRDFMPPGSAYLVPTRRVALERDYGPYRAGLTWGEPDVAAAAELMRRAVDDPAGTAAVAAEGRRVAGERLSMAAYARRVSLALEVSPAG